MTSENTSILFTSVDKASKIAKVLTQRPAGYPTKEIAPCVVADLYDPALELVSRHESLGSVSLNIPKLIRGFVKNPVQRYTFPVSLITMARPPAGPIPRITTATSSQVAGMWEAVDRQRADGSDWAVVIGTSTGARPSGQEILKARYDLAAGQSQNFWARARHTLISIAPGRLITIMGRTQEGEVDLVFRVDSLHQWPSDSDIVVDPSRPAALANVTLVCAHKALRDGSVQAYRSDDLPKAVEAAGVCGMVATCREMLYNHSATPRYIRKFYRPHWRNTESMPASHEVKQESITRYTSESAENFLPDLQGHLGKYRAALIAATFTHKASHALPVTFTYEVDLDAEGGPTITIVAEVPSFLKEEDFGAFEVAATLQGSIPPNLVDESLLTFGTRTFEAFLTQAASEEDPRHMFTWL